MLYLLNRYGSALRARIGKYTCQHGPTAVARYFSRTLKDHTISKSIVHSIMKSYLNGVKQRRRIDGGGDIVRLCEKKRGRPLLLGGVTDAKVQAYIRKVCEGGGTISSRVVIAAPRGILLRCEKHKLQEFGGHINLNVHWAQSFLSRMNFVQRKGTTAKSKLTPTDFKKKKDFLNDIFTIAQMEEIPAELIMNWDQTA